MVLPIIMCITMLLLFFCLYSYQKSMLLQVASSVSEQAAYNWDNSRKAKDGSLTDEGYDSLYWRVGDDRLLSGLFGAVEDGSAASIALPHDMTEGEDLPAVKLGKAAERIPGNLTGQMDYSYRIAGRTVAVRLERVMNLPVLDEILHDGAKPEVSARSLAADPVEFIRTVDLMRYYGAKFKGGTSEGEHGTGMKREDASAMMAKLGRQ